MTAKKLLIGSIIATVILPFAAFLIPAPDNMVSISPGQFRASLAITIFEALLYVSAAIFFVTGLKSFSQRLRRIYIAICLGIVLNGLNALQIPFLVAQDIFNGPWVRGGGIAVPNALAALAFFLSLYFFARTLGIKSRWVSPLVVLPMVVLIALGSTLVLTQITPFGFAIEVSAIALAGASALVAIQIRRHVGVVYTKAMIMLAAALFVLMCAFAVAASYNVLFLKANAGMGVLYAVDGILFLVAGFTFKRLSDDNMARATPASAIEVISYIAGLISNTRAVDPQLDTFRFVTSGLEPGQSLSTQDQIALAEVYTKLEQHLIAHDPLRNFSQQSLRTNLNRRFPVRDPREATFWKTFDESNA